MTNGEINDLFDKLRDAAKEIPVPGYWLNRICRELEKPKREKVE